MKEVLILLFQIIGVVLLFSAVCTCLVLGCYGICRAICWINDINWRNVGRRINRFRLEKTSGWPETWPVNKFEFYPDNSANRFDFNRTKN